MKKYNNLTPEERKIIELKGTEPPGTGEYTKCYSPGIYVCKKCNQPLYMSSDKFDSGCGWPSFDDEIPGAVLKQPDRDGRRIEIVCSRCKGHLGHFFEGEELTKKNVRHCVNSLSIRFIPAFTKEGYEKATFAGGCFWGVEALMKKQKGIISTTCGYIGGETVDPTYEEVKTGKTGHFEAVQIIFNPEIISYEDIAKLFFEIHDPTQRFGQGVDIGPQYRSAIFYYTLHQKEIAQRLIDILKQKKGLDVQTMLLPASVFYEAEESHQDYYDKNSDSPPCHIRKKLFD